MVVNGGDAMSVVGEWEWSIRSQDKMYKYELVCAYYVCYSGLVVLAVYVALLPTLIASD